MYKPLLICGLLVGTMPIAACQTPVSQASSSQVQTVKFLNLRLEEISRLDFVRCLTVYLKNNRNNININKLFLDKGRINDENESP